MLALNLVLATAAYGYPSGLPSVEETSGTAVAANLACLAADKWCGNCNPDDGTCTPDPGFPCCGFCDGTKGTKWQMLCTAGDGSPPPPSPPASPPFLSPPPSPPRAPKQIGGYDLGFYKRSISTYVPQDVDFQVLFNGHFELEHIKDMANAGARNMWVSQNEPVGACDTCKVGPTAPKYVSAGMTAPALINVGGGTGAPGASWGREAAVYETVKALTGYIKQGFWEMEYSSFCNEQGTTEKKRIDLTNFVGISYDIEMGGVDWKSLEASLKLVKQAGLKTMVTVAHTGTDVSPETMQKIIGSDDVDILSPQLYGASGCDLATNTNPSAVTWDMFNDFKGQFIPSVAYGQQDGPIQLVGYNKPISKLILWPGDNCHTSCPAE